MKEKFLLKVDGVDVEDEVDWNDKESLKKKLQLAHAAEKRMNEAKGEKKKALDIIKAFEQDPESMLSRLGPKGREIAEKFLLKQIQDQMMSPEEKAQRSDMSELEILRKEKKEREEKTLSDAQAAKEAEHAKSFQETIIGALEKSGLPKSPDLVRRMAKIMHKNLDMGLELSSDDLVLEVKKEVTSLLRAIVGDSDGDKLLGLFGPDVAKKIRQSDLKKLQEKQSTVFGQPKKAGGQVAPANDRPMTIDEWKENLAKRYEK
ncbi:hypothetical protein [Bdellovibrio sp. HCB288]|uniref:hypothetical protein n=1 Tax=Bdellovibrio sp. HCB288 TaxID=3394355 RepID=UPI0039B48787